MLGWTSDPLVCVSVLESVLFRIWAAVTALASFFATGGCERHRQDNNIKQQQTIVFHSKTSRELDMLCMSIFSKIKAFESY